MTAPGASSREYVLGYLAREGPATIPEMAGGYRARAALRAVLYGLERDGLVERICRRRTGRPGPQPWLWALPRDADTLNAAEDGDIEQPSSDNGAFSTILAVSRARKARSTR